MSTRVDAVALRSLVYLSAGFAFAAMMRFGCSEAPRHIAPNVGGVSITPANEIERSAASAATPQPIQIQSFQPTLAPVTPIPKTPVPFPAITHIRVEPTKWSEPLLIPEELEVRISFSLRRIRIELDGVDVGILHHNVPMILPDDGKLAPLRPSHRERRSYLFHQEPRVIRFRSLDDERSEDVKVVWQRKFNWHP